MKICRKGTGSAAGENDFCTKQTETDPVNGGNTKRGCCKEKNIGIVMHKRVVPAGAVDITDEVLKN